MRRRWVWDEKLKALVEVPTDYRAPSREAPMIFGDIPEYVSPASGLVVRGRRARREDLKRTQSRPWEGLEQEKREAERQRQYAEARSDRKLEEHARRALAQMPPDRRRIFGA